MYIWFLGYLDGNPDDDCQVTRSHKPNVYACLCVCNELIAFVNSISNDNDSKLKCYQPNNVVHHNLAEILKMMESDAYAYAYMIMFACVFVHTNTSRKRKRERETLAKGEKNQIQKLWAVFSELNLINKFVIWQRRARGTERWQTHETNNII